MRFTSSSGRVARIAVGVVGTGILAGVVGAFMVLFLHLAQWIAFGHDELLLLDTLRLSPAWRRALAVPVGAALAGFGWWALRRSHPVTTASTALAQPDADFPVLRTTADALLQVLVVGSGTSVGREAAPRQMAAALSNFLSRFLELEWKWRRLLIATGAGAALGAVYNTPLAAIPFSLSIVLGQWSTVGVLVSLCVSALAVPLAWMVTDGLPSTPLAVGVASSHAVLTVYLWAVAAVPLCAAVGILFKRASGAAQRRARAGDSTWRMVLAMTGTGIVTGIVGLALPQLLGNGKSTLDVLFGNTAPFEPILIGVLLAVLVLKPLLTVLVLRTGVVGGLLMPSLATGAALGGVVGLVFIRFGVTDDAVALFAVVGAVGILSVTQASPLFATVFTLELTHAAVWMWPPILIAGFGSHGVIKLVERLRREPPNPSS